MTSRIGIAGSINSCRESIDLRRNPLHDKTLDSQLTNQTDSDTVPHPFSK